MLPPSHGTRRLVASSAPIARTSPIVDESWRSEGEIIAPCGSGRSGFAIPLSSRPRPRYWMVTPTFHRSTASNRPYPGNGSVASVATGLSTMMHGVRPSSNPDVGSASGPARSPSPAPLGPVSIGPRSRRSPGSSPRRLRCRSCCSPRPARCRSRKSHPRPSGDRGGSSRSRSPSPHSYGPGAVKPRGSLGNVPRWVLRAPAIGGGSVTGTPASIADCRIAFRASSDSPA